MNKTKKCKTCGEEFPATPKYFRKQGDSLRGKCKKCTAKDKKQWDIKNEEHCLKYREDNKDTRSEYSKEYHRINKEQESEYKKEYYKINKDSMLIKKKEYRKNNKDIISIKNKEYQKNNRELCNSYKHKRRALQASLPATLTLPEWEFIKDSFNSECAYCGEKLSLTQDHYIPLSKLGSYELGNILPACQSCNSSKNNSEFQIWFKKHENYTPERESKILNFIEETKAMNLINHPMTVPA